MCGDWHLTIEEEQRFLCSSFWLTVGIRLRLPLPLQVIHVLSGPVLDLSYLIVIEIPFSCNNASILQRNRNFFSLPSDMHMRNPLNPIVTVVSVNHIGHSIRCIRHDAYGLLFKIISLKQAFRYVNIKLCFCQSWNLCFYNIMQFFFIHKITSHFQITIYLFLE